MATAFSDRDKDSKSKRESGDDSEEESENLEESPCGRWLKRREEVNCNFYQRFLCLVISFMNKFQLQVFN